MNTAQLNALNYKTEEEVEKIENNKRKKLTNEYESAFSGEEMMTHSLLSIKSKISIKAGTIKVDDVITSNFKKVAREESVIGLTGVIGEWGVVSPIHVATLEDEDSFMLLEGLRRLFGAIRNGVTEIPAMIWDFEDKEEAKEKANMIGLMLNRSQRFTNKELWEQLQLLEEQNRLGPGMIEFLLQMNAGEAMKLKDIMLADFEFNDIQVDLLSNVLTIDAAYRKLTTARKKENRLEKDDARVIEDSSIGANQNLNIDEVKSLLDIADTLTDDSGSLEDMDRSNEVRGDVVQSTDDRHPVDREVKRDTLIRDNYQCRCCSKGGKQWASVLVYHHLIPVHCGGPDSVENGLTLCVNCHLTLHTYEVGKLNVVLKELSEEEQVIFKNIFKYGNVAIEANKRIGMKKEDVFKAETSSRRHPFPTELLKDNLETMNASN